MFASSPEELETLLEDAVLMGDETSVADLFAAGGVIVTGRRISDPDHALTELVKVGYVATPRTVSVKRNVAVVVGDDAVNVSFRGHDGSWRLLVAVVRT